MPSLSPLSSLEPIYSSTPPPGQKYMPKEETKGQCSKLMERSNSERVHNNVLIYPLNFNKDWTTKFKHQTFRPRNLVQENAPATQLRAD